jgi:hypothetical protein
MGSTCVMQNFADMHHNQYVLARYGLSNIAFLYTGCVAGSANTPEMKH